MNLAQICLYIMLTLYMMLTLLSTLKAKPKSNVFYIALLTIFIKWLTKELLHPNFQNKIISVSDSWVLHLLCPATHLCRQS